MKSQDLLNRLDYLIGLGNQGITQIPTGRIYVPSELYNGFRSASISFLNNILKENHTYCREFSKVVINTQESTIKCGIKILEALKNEVENGWLVSFKGLVTAEIFSDFLEMSKYLLDEQYKDPAAVMIGSVLEEHLRHLCNIHSVDLTSLKGTDVIPKKADLLNSDLVKAGAYGVLEQKQVTGWLHLRNSAAHGKYSDYTPDQVNLMYQGVLDFITRVK